MLIKLGYLGILNWYTTYMNAIIYGCLCLNVIAIEAYASPVSAGIGPAPFVG